MRRTGIFSMSRRLMPMVMVVRLEGHEPHAPCRRRYTTGPSISTNSTLPPSAIRYGRICTRVSGKGSGQGLGQGPIYRCMGREWVTPCDM